MKTYELIDPRLSEKHLHGINARGETSAVPLIHVSDLEAVLRALPHLKRISVPIKSTYSHLYEDRKAA